MIKRIPLDEHLVLVFGRDGTFLVNRHDIFIGQAVDVYGEYVPEEARFLRALVKPGDNVIEVGANMGAHTVGLAKAIAPGLMVAFEPQPNLYALLQAQIALNHLSNVRALNAGCSDCAAELNITRYDYLEDGNFGGCTLGDGDGDLVAVVRLDDVIATDREIRLIKIDVEGMEEAVIRGGIELIKRCKPLLYVEHDRVEKSRSLVACLLELGYRLWWHVPPLFSGDNFFAEPMNVYDRLASFNMICAPVERQPSELFAAFPEILSPDTPHPLAEKHAAILNR
jgi:FkbM family methyltransferase